MVNEFRETAGPTRGDGEPAYKRDPVLAEASGGHPSKRPTWGCRPGRSSPAWPCSGWGLPSRPGHPGRWCALTAPFHPYLCCEANFAAIGGLLSVALSTDRSPRPGSRQHLALWSPDFPRHRTLRRRPMPRPPGRLTVPHRLTLEHCAVSWGVAMLKRSRFAGGPGGFVEGPEDGGRRTRGDAGDRAGGDIEAPRDLVADAEGPHRRRLHW